MQNHVRNTMQLRKNHAMKDCQVVDAFVLRRSQKHEKG